MIQRIINKLFIIIALVIILFFLLPVSLGFDLNVVKQPSQDLVYTKTVPFDQLRTQDRLLIKNQQAGTYIDSFTTINPVTQTILMEDGKVVTENGVVGKVVVVLPFMGSVYNTLLAIEYDLKLQILVIIMIIYITPEILKTLVKKWSNRPQKMIQ